MSLKFSKAGDILEVIEEINWFTHSIILYWYYDIKNWKKSISGKQGEIPTLEMSTNSIEWVEKYYLPKVL